MSSNRRHRSPRAGDVIRAAIVVGVAVGGYQAAASEGGVSHSADWIREIDVPTVTMPDIDLPNISLSDLIHDDTPWTWRGASAGEVRTVVIDIDSSIYPVDGVEWLVNGQHDRFDRRGPLDEELGLWHSRTQSFKSGDVITACWQSADGERYHADVTVP